jgi:protein disulfide-isomerase
MLRSFSFLLVFLSLPLFGLETVRLAEHMQKSEKPALLVFLTSEGCPWCDKLVTDILDQEEFREPISESFNLLKVYMSDASREEISKKYHIDQVPIFVLVDKEGQEITRVGYLPKTPKEMAAHLKGIILRAELLQEKIAQLAPKAMPIEILRHYYTEAKTIGLKKTQDALLSIGLQVDPGTFFLMEQYKIYLGSERKKAKKLKEEIQAKDPDNHEGSHLQLAFLDFQLRQEEKMTVNQVVKPLTKYLKHFGQQDKENRWKVEMTLTQYFFSKEDKKQALEYARKALQDAPLEAQEEIREALRYIIGQQ